MYKFWKMPKGNERGYILPYTLLITMIIFSSLLHTIHLLTIEQRFIQEKKRAFDASNLIEVSIKQLSEQNASKWSDGAFQFEEGQVKYKVTALDEQHVEIVLIANTNDGGYLQREYMVERKNIAGE